MSGESVEAAYEMLLDELSTHLAELSEAMQRTVHDKEFEATQRLAEQARFVKGMYEEVADLLRRWQQTMGGTRLSRASSRVGRHGGLSRRRTPRIKRGLAIPQREYQRPLLEALVSLGGAAPAHEVLRWIEEAMKDRFTAHDLAPLSASGTPRWRVNVLWCRFHLAKEGLLNPDAPGGFGR